MYSDSNVFENNTFTENAAGAAIMFSKELTVRGNHFVNNRGLRAYGIIIQSTERSRFEGNQIEENAVGLSFNQCIGNTVVGNHVRNNYIGLKFGSNSDDNRFSENVFARNLHPVETGVAEGSGNQWALNGIGNFWEMGADLDFDHDGVRRPAASRAGSLWHSPPRLSCNCFSLRQPGGQIAPTGERARRHSGPELD
jgi:nitrous oxidase accessory protein